MGRHYLLILFVTLLGNGLITSSARSAEVLHQPVDCTIGQDCWVVHYVDTQAAHNMAQDYQCGSLTYDGHDGSDFAIRDLLTMETGVDVLAALEGEVLRLRDGVEDKEPSKEEITQMLAEHKGCGNGIVLQHKEGWQTLYCHLKQGSLMVKEGEHVKAGQPLAKVGHSGIAEFPHLHFIVMKDSVLYDPFTGLPAQTSCDSRRDGVTPLWQQEITYEPLSIYAAGFQRSPPLLDALKIAADSPEKLTLGKGDPVIFWALFYGLQKGDLVTLKILDEAGDVLASRSFPQEKTRIRQMYYMGKPFNPAVFATGNYKGEVHVTRKSPDIADIVRTRTVDIRIEAP